MIILRNPIIDDTDTTTFSFIALSTTYFTYSTTIFYNITFIRLYQKILL